MARRYLPVNQIVEGIKGWTVLVQVIERGHVQVSRGARPINYRRFLLTDSEGTKVSAVIYGNDIRYFAGMLLPFRRYYISSASLRKSDLKYRVSDYPHSWVIHNRTLIEEYAEQAPPPIPCHIDLTEFKNLFRFADTENLQNVMAVVVHAFPPKEQGLDSTTRDFVLINEEKMPMILTLWNEFEANEGMQLANTIADGNIIIAMRVKVTTFSYLSMTTRVASSLLINPPTPQATPLREWYDQNREEISHILQSATYKDSAKLLPPPEDTDIITIKTALNTLKDIKTAWIQGNTTMTPGQRSLWYTACINCQKAVDAPLEWVIKCLSCKEESGVEARCRIGIIVDDGTSSMNTVIFGKDAEKLIPFTAVQLKDADEHDVDLFSELAFAINTQHLLCFVRHFDSDHHGQKDDKYNIVKAYTNDEVQQFKLAITEKAVVATASVSVLSATAIAKDPVQPTTHLSTIGASNEQLTNEKQFFSPTTKLVLESIAQPSDIAQASPSSKTPAKRSLTFESADDTHDITSTAKTAAELFPLNPEKSPSDKAKTHASKSTDTSPLKKQRESRE